jgi:hypothetical protein
MLDTQKCLNEQDKPELFPGTTELLGQLRLIQQSL